MINKEGDFRMQLSISQTAKLMGISVRTLHYYDEIDLLKPSKVTEAGYRYYGEEALACLQQILFYRELDFSLKDIKLILAKTDYDRKLTLENHKELLLLKQKHLQNLIMLVDETLKGDIKMEFELFDTNEIEEAKQKYAQEVKKKWGNTPAYKESTEKSNGYSKKDWDEISKEADGIFRSFAMNMDKKPADANVQKIVHSWQEHITKYYYHCTKDILAELGEMYVADHRFTNNIDKFGKGTAKFMSDAIKIYCAK